MKKHTRNYPSPSPCVKTYLKTGTHATHTAIHRNAMLQKVLRGELTTMGYHDLIRCFLEIHRATQEMINALSHCVEHHIPAPFTLEQNIALLEQDLGWITKAHDIKGQNTQALSAVITAQLCQARPNTPQSLSAYVLGQLYSLHGAHMGRPAFIKGTEHLFAKTPQLSPIPLNQCSPNNTPGRLFFTSSPEAAGKLWAKFCVLLQTRLNHPHLQPTALAGAQACFQAIDTGLNFLLQ